MTRCSDMPRVRRVISRSEPGFALFPSEIICAALRGLEGREGFRMDAQSGFPDHLRDPKPEELDVPREFDAAFAVVHLQLHPLAQESGDRFQHAFPGFPASDKDYDVVGVAHEAQAG